MTNGFAAFADVTFADIGSSTVVVIVHNPESGTIHVYVYAPKIGLVSLYHGDLDGTIITPSVAVTVKEPVLDSWIVTPLLEPV